MTDKDDGHVCVPANQVIKWPYCRRSGVIKRADGKNKPCKGPVKVELRDGKA